MLVYIVFPNRTVQENLAKSYEALGRYLQAKAAYFDPDDDDVDAKQRTLARANSEVVQAFEQTRVSLFYRLRRHNRQTRTQKMLRYYYTAQDILERASSSHYQYHEFFQQLKNSDLIFASNVSWSCKLWRAKRWRWRCVMRNAISTALAGKKQCKAYLILSIIIKNRG